MHGIGEYWIMRKSIFGLRRKEGGYVKGYLERILFDFILKISKAFGNVKYYKSATR